MTQQQVQTIDVAMLRLWLEENRNVLVLDVRPQEQRQEWHIPGSIHVDVYAQLKAGERADLSQFAMAHGTPIVTVCAAGKVSQLAARQLASEGYTVYSLQGGMNAWSAAWNVAALPLGEEALILQIRRTGKGCLSYLIGSAGEAVVIDPSVEASVYQHLAAQNGWQIKSILETHLHADHLSRIRALSELTGATIVLPQGDPRHFPFQSIHDGERLAVGSLSLRAIATPGHTDGSFSYYIEEGVVFTGDTLFTNGVGRPDLHTHKGESRSRAALLFDSLQKLTALPQETRILPGHTAQPVAFDGQLITALLGQLTQTLPVLALSKEAFVETILARIPATPPNYLAITDANARGHFEAGQAVELEAGANRCAIS